MNNNIEKIIKKLERGFLGFWIKQYKVSFLLVFLMIILGFSSLFLIDKESSPDLDLGIINIGTSYIGVNPLDIDSLITDKIEKEIKDIEGIKSIKSISSLGFSNITLELENGVSIQDTMIEIKDSIDIIDFPEDALDTIVQDVSSKDNRLFSIVFYADETNYSKDYLLNKTIILKNALEGKPGINSINVKGGQDYEIRILIDKDKLDKLGLSIASISNTINNHNQNTPIGNYSIGDLSYDFRFEGEINDLKGFLNIPILLNDGNIVYLGDISTINKHFLNDSVSKLGIGEKKGFNSLILDIEKSDNEDFFGSSIQAKELLLNEINGINYEGINYEIHLDSSEILKQSYTDLFYNMMTTFGLVFITLLIFIGFKEGFIAILIVPLSYLITFIVLYYGGFSLNSLTNFSLILSLGIAIDTIIVVIEGANKKVKLGYHPKHAILVAIREYAPPIISGTMTTLAAFIPLLTLPGVIGKYLSYIPITVFITLLASLFLSLTVVSAIFMKLTKNIKYYRINEKEEFTISKNEKSLLEYDREGKVEKKGDRGHFREKIFDGLINFYYKLLNNIIKKSILRLFIIFTPILLLFISFGYGNGFTLFPVSDNIQITFKVEATQGTTTKTLEKVLPLLYESLSEIPEIKIYTLDINDNIVSGVIELFSQDYRDSNNLRDAFMVESAVNENLDILKIRGYKVTSGVLAGGPPGGKAVGINIIAESTQYLETLSDVSNVFENYLLSLEGTKNVGLSISSTPGQFVFSLDYEKIAQLGITPNEITNSIFANTNGLTAGTIKGLLTDHDIKVKIAEFENNLSPYDLENLVLNTSKGKIKLIDIASYKFEKAISEINRDNTDITVLIDSDLIEGFVQSDIQPILTKFAESYNFPVGISYSAGGEAEENQDLIIGTLIAFVISLFLIFTILVLQFNSYGQPIIILYSVVLALLGVNIGLLIMGLPYSMAFAIGFIALTGIVINNAIIYIDKINTNLKEGLIGYDAILQAGKSRLIPMLVTTITTVLGILPIALQDQFWAGLGFTIIFGLFTGTLMTLFVIPILYYQVFLKKRGWIGMIISLIIIIILFIIYSYIKKLFM